MSYLDLDNSYLKGDFLLDKISQAFFATLLDEDLEQDTSNKDYESLLGTWALIFKRLLGLPHRTSEREAAYLAEVLDKDKQTKSEPAYSWLEIVSYVFGGVIIEPIKALWKIAFEFPIRIVEVTLLHIRQFLKVDGIVNKILYGIEQFIALPRLLSRAIFRPMRSYYLVGTEFEENSKLRKFAQVTSAVVSILVAVGVAVALPFLIHVIAPSVASIVARVSPQLGQAIAFLGTSLGAALAIGVAAVQAMFNAILPMSIMLKKNKYVSSHHMTSELRVHPTLATSPAASVSSASSSLEVQVDSVAKGNGASISPLRRQSFFRTNEIRTAPAVSDETTACDFGSTTSLSMRSSSE